MKRTDHITEDYPPLQGESRWLSPEHVRQVMTDADPTYGADFTEVEWRRITGRIEALARLLWKYSVRKAGQQPSVTGPRNPEITVGSSNRRSR